jgi:aldose 1-epimerase
MSPTVVPHSYPSASAFAKYASVLLGLISFFFGSSGVAADARRTPFGHLSDGTAVEAAELSNGAGMSVRIMTLGATIQSLFVPDRRGSAGDVVLGFDTAQEYFQGTGYFGATVGRFANRIAKGRFRLDGRDYVLAANDHSNHLHGGKRGFDKVIWTLDSVQSGSPACARFSYVSVDGEEGYPGTLSVTATYCLDERDTLKLDYAATTDKSTIVNISGHSYFNLHADRAGASAMDHLLQIYASRYTPVDAQLIPTGELRNVSGTPFDFRQPRVVGARVRDGGDPQILYGRGYDHNFVLDGSGGTPRVAVRVHDPKSGRVLEILTAAPGLQFYSGNFLDGTIVGKGKLLYRQGDALVFEPQLFPDSPNQPGFPSARLDPGNVYRNTVTYRFSIDTR